MLIVGEMNTLEVKRVLDNGYIIFDAEDGELFLPRFEKPEGVKVGDEISVFLYRNARKEIVPTTMQPYVMPGEFGFLAVDEISSAGALLDWGLTRQLFMPSREMKMKMYRDREYLVYVYYDAVTQQIIATGRVDNYINVSEPNYRFNQEVDILVAFAHERGFKVIVNNAHWGMIYESEIFLEVNVGDKIKGYVKKVREDGKIDIALQPQGIHVVDSLSEQILSELKANGGRLDVSDRSDADEIASMFGCSKKSFKKAIGTLFKMRKIEIHEHYICLV